MRVDVSGSGAVMLDNVATCDGFVYNYPIRVQTHIHKDHMAAFSSSKGLQHILLTRGTLDLLIAEYNADIPHRGNIEAIPLNQITHQNDCLLRLLDNGHMLGSVQVELTTSDGFRCGYSGDFAWPLDDVIQVEELVLDSSYGSPDSVRRFTIEEANDRFVDLVVHRITSGPVMILAHRGVLERAISSLADAVKEPIIGSHRVCNEWEVYRQHGGYSLTNILDEKSEEAKSILRERRYIRLFGTGDRRPTLRSDAIFIELSARMNQPDDVILELSDNSFRVAISNHADYNGTLEYVRSTGAKRVMTDNCRKGHAVELALALKRELGIDAQPSQNEYSREWGK